ncbi:MAG TPA: hypothetical protein VGC10_06565 [Sphingomonas sp.]
MVVFHDERCARGKIEPVRTEYRSDSRLRFFAIAAAEQIVSGQRCFGEEHGDLRADMSS